MNTTPDMGRVYINEHQYFDGVSTDIWNFFVGGYQPAQQWLKSKRRDYEDNNLLKNNKISNPMTESEIKHYQNLLNTIEKTIQYMTKLIIFFVRLHPKILLFPYVRSLFFQTTYSIIAPSSSMLSAKQSNRESQNHLTSPQHEAEIIDIIAQGRSESTRGIYEDNFRFFQLWALEQDLPYLPASQQSIELYILHLRDREHKMATIELRISSIKAMHKAFVRPFPQIPHFSEIMREAAA